MSVRVIDTSGVLWHIADDENGHAGEADPSTLSYAADPLTGQPNRDLIVIPCPEPDCGTMSYWPRSAFSQEVQDKLP